MGNLLSAPVDGRAVRRVVVAILLVVLCVDDTGGNKQRVGLLTMVEGQDTEPAPYNCTIIEAAMVGPEVVNACSLWNKFGCYTYLLENLPDACRRLLLFVRARTGQPAPFAPQEPLDCISDVTQVMQMLISTNPDDQHITLCPGVYPVDTQRLIGASKTVDCAVDQEPPQCIFSGATFTQTGSNSLSWPLRL